MKKKVKNKENNMYLPEDQKLLDELEESGTLSLGEVSPIQNKHLQIAQIKALMRSRKSFDKASKSTDIVSTIIVAFAIIQIVIALMQFIMDTFNSSHKVESFFVVVALAGFIVYVLCKFDSIIGDK